MVNLFFLWQKKDAWNIWNSSYFQFFVSFFRFYKLCIFVFVCPLFCFVKQICDKYEEEYCLFHAILRNKLKYWNFQLLLSFFTHKHYYFLSHNFGLCWLIEFMYNKRKCESFFLFMHSFYPCNCCTSRQ